MRCRICFRKAEHSDSGEGAPGRGAILEQEASVPRVHITSAGLDLKNHKTLLLLCKDGSAGIGLNFCNISIAPQRGRAEYAHRVANRRERQAVARGRERYARTRIGHGQRHDFP
jgi:hypothetical protein